MRHLKTGRKLNRTAAHRRALIRNLLKALIQREQIQTTDAKAKELRRWADRIVTLGKRNTLHARRLVFRHPAAGDERGWTAAPPDDLKALLAALADDAGTHGRRQRMEWERT